MLSEAFPTIIMYVHVEKTQIPEVPVRNQRTGFKIAMEFSHLTANTETVRLLERLQGHI